MSVTPKEWAAKRPSTKGARKFGPRPRTTNPRQLLTVETIRTFLEQQTLLSMFLVITLGYRIGAVNLRGFNLLQDVRESMK